MSYRTFLFTPGDHARRVEKALGLAADAVILDLEDAVAESKKAATRPLIVEALQCPRQGHGYVRVNALSTPFGYEDLVGVVGPGLDGVFLPKVESASELLTAEWLLAQLERKDGREIGGIDLIPIIETALGLEHIREIASANTRVRRIAFGAADFTFDLDMTWSATEHELAFARSAIVNASRAAGLEAPIDSAWTRLDDLDGLEQSARRVADTGFQGKLCIHPTQLPVVNAVFTPSDDEVRYAHEVVDAFDSAAAEGSAALQVNGKFIDYPIYYKAKKTLALAEEIQRG